MLFPPNRVFSQNLSSLVGMGLLCFAIQLNAQFSYFESFTGTSAPGWTFSTGGGAPDGRLTANAAPDATDPETGTQIDADGNGWLRLSTNAGGQDNVAYLSTNIPSSANDISVSFDFTAWSSGGSTRTVGGEFIEGADGLAVFFYDADVPFNEGSNGGSLSYAPLGSSSGLHGAYFGVGIDVWGNFSDDDEGRSGSDPNLTIGGIEADPGDIPNAVVVRGPDDSVLQDGTGNYYYLAGTGGNNYTTAGDDSIDALDPDTQNLNFDGQDFRPDQDADDYRRLSLNLDGSDQLTVQIEFGKDNGLETLFVADLSSFDRPDNLRIGFGAATGGAYQVFELRNLEITADGLDDTWYWTDSNGNDLWDTAANWSPNTSAPATFSDVVFGDTFVTNSPDDTVTINGSDKTIGNLFFTGEYSYTLDAQTNQKLIFDTDTGGSKESEITILNNPDGNADHTVNVDIELSNDFDVNNLVMQTLTLTGDIDSNGNNILFETTGTTIVTGIISEGADITVMGTGTTTLSAANSYTGTTTVQSGVLQIENNTALGNAGADTFVQSGGTLALANNINTASDETIDIAGAGSNNQGALSNASDTNTWAGQIDLTADATIGATGGQLNLSSANQIDAAGFALTFNAATATTIDVDRVITDSTGTSALLKEGDGTVILSQNNTYAGITTINDGTLQIQNASALGDTTNGTVVNDGGTLAIDGSLTISSAETFTVTGNGNTGQAALWAESGSSEIDGAITITGGSASFGANTGATLNLDSTIGGANQDVNINGDGVVVFKAPNSYTGATNINSGTLRYADAGDRISDASAITVASGATYDLNNFDDTVGSIAGAGDITLGGADLTFGGDNSSTTFSGVISETGNIIKQGTGTLTLSGNNTHTGNIQINAGTIQMDSANTFADASDLILNGGTLAVNGVSDTLDNFTLQSNSTLDFLGENGGHLTFDDITRTAGLLTVDNWAGDFTNGNGNTRLQVTSSSLGGSFLTNTQFTGWGNGSQLLDLGGGIYEVVPDLSGFFEWDGGESGNQNNGVWQADGGAEWVGNIAPPDRTAGTQVLFANEITTNAVVNINANGTGTTAEQFTRTVGTMIINNTDGNNYRFRTASTTTDGTLRFDQTGTADAHLTIAGNGQHRIDVGNNRVLNVDLQDNLVITNNSTANLGLRIGRAVDNNTIDTNGNNLTFRGAGTTLINGTIIDSGSVIKNDTGTLQLAGTNTFTGGFTLNEGTVEIRNNSAFGTGTLTVNGGILEAVTSDRTVDETYVIGGDFTVANNGNRDLTFSGNGTLSAGTQSITVENGIDFNLTGDLSGTGGLTKEGNGTLNLTGNDSNFSGGLIVNDGTVATTAADNLAIGSTVAGDNYLGSGDITVNTGGTLTATMSGDNDIDINAGATVTNTGGTLTLQNTNANSDFELFGNLVTSGGTTTLDVGDNFDLEAGGSITSTGGTLNINAGDDFVTAGTSNISASNGATINIDLSGGNTGVFTLNQNDTLSLDGPTTAVNITGDNATNIDLDGTVSLNNGSTLTVLAGETNLDSTTLLDGGTATLKGTLEVRGDLNINLPQLSNSPNITINSDSATEIASLSGTTTFENIGTLTKAGTGTTTINANVNNIQANQINLTGGTFLNATDDQIANNTDLQLSFGTWNTGGNSEVLGTLTLDETSVIDLSNGASIIEFADSTGVDGDWDTNDWVLIDNWSGDFINGGGTDQIIFGNAGLTEAQLGRILFRDPGTVSGVYFAQFIGNEIVPIVPIPEPTTYVMGALAAGILFWFERRRRNK